MEKLLKDMPEFAERIENNVFLKNDISEAIRTTENTSLSGHQSEFIAEQVIQVITDFVNQNYEWKGVCK